MRRSTPLLLALAALAGCGSTGSSTRSTPTPVRISPAAQAKGNSLAFHSFGIFRRPRRPADAIPVDEAVGGVKPTLSRLAYSGPLGMLFVYLHDGMLCVSYEVRVSPIAGTGIGRCDQVADAQASGIALPIPASTDRFDRLALVLPDGVRQVTVTRVGGSSASVAVAGNALVNGGIGLRGWSFTAPNGLRHSQLLRPGGPPKTPPHAP